MVTVSAGLIHCDTVTWLRSLRPFLKEMGAGPLVGRSDVNGDEASVLLHGAINVMWMLSLVRWRGCWSRRLGGGPLVDLSTCSRGGKGPQLT